MATAVEKSIVGLKKLKMELLCDPSIPPLGTYPEKLKAGPRSYIGMPTFIAAFFTVFKK